MTDERKDRLLTVLLTSPQGKILGRYEMDVCPIMTDDAIMEVVPRLLSVRRQLTGDGRKDRPIRVSRGDDLPEYLRKGTHR